MLHIEVKGQRTERPLWPKPGPWLMAFWKTETGWCLYRNCEVCACDAALKAASIIFTDVNFCVWNQQKQGIVALLPSADIVHVQGHCQQQPETVRRCVLNLENIVLASLKMNPTAKCLRRNTDALDPLSQWRRKKKTAKQNMLHKRTAT